MKKFLKSAAALLAAMAIVTPAFAAPEDDTISPSTNKTVRFTDIDTENFAWARPYINSMALKGLISGYEDGTFRPDNDVTRLEAFSLFARAMGSNDAANSEIIDIAHDKYDSIIDNYDLKWGGDEIAYLMYKGALKRSDLDTYLKDDEKNTPMKRYEAAIIITKAMGGEEKALSDLGVVLDYTDAREVPSNAIQYVAYATESEIMEGMGDGTFSPNTPVKRSQISVMLSRTVDKTDYSFKKVKITAVDSQTREITLTDTDGTEAKYVYTDDTVIKSLGDEIQASSLIAGVDAVAVLSADKLAALDVLSAQPDKTVRGKYQGSSTTSGVTSIRITPDDENDNTTYECADGMTVTYDGSPATVRSFTKGDYVTLEISNGKIVKMTGETKTTTVSGAVIDNIDITDDIKITISHGKEEYNGQTYSVSSDVLVKKNDATVGLDEIYKGDKVNLTLEYGVITKIVATSSRKVYDGTIKSLTIAAQSTMVVNVKGKDTTYQIPKDVEITINGEEGTLYDFRVGDMVKITVESEAITKIYATSTQESSGHVIGVVTAVNTSYGVISIKQDGMESVIQIMAKDDTAKFNDVNGNTKKMKDIKVGQTLDIRGTVSNGVFIGKLIIIVSD